jgi:hypothetical protein
MVGLTKKQKNGKIKVENETDRNKTSFQSQENGLRAYVQANEPTLHRNMIRDSGFPLAKLRLEAEADQIIVIMTTHAVG